MEGKSTGLAVRRPRFLFWKFNRETALYQHPKLAVNMPTPRQTPRIKLKKPRFGVMQAQREISALLCSGRVMPDSSLTLLILSFLIFKIEVIITVLIQRLLNGITQIND